MYYNVSSLTNLNVNAVLYGNLSININENAVNRLLINIVIGGNIEINLNGESVGSFNCGLSFDPQLQYYSLGMEYDTGVEIPSDFFNGFIDVFQASPVFWGFWLICQWYY